MSALIHVKTEKEQINPAYCDYQERRRSNESKGWYCQPITVKSYDKVPVAM